MTGTLVALDQVLARFEFAAPVEVADLVVVQAALREVAGGAPVEVVDRGDHVEVTAGQYPVLWRRTRPVQP